MAFPSVFGIERGINVSDAQMFNYLGEGAQDEVIHVMRHGIRGILGAADAHTKKKKNGDEKKGVAQIQVTETARTAPDAKGLKLRFKIRPSPILGRISGCNDFSYRKKFDAFLTIAQNSSSMHEVSRRYARNILNARWMNRNKVLGSNVRVSVRWSGGSVESKGFGRLGFGEHEQAYTAEEETLSKALMDVFRGLVDNDFIVEGIVEFEAPASMQVYPSQNYVSNKPTGFARSLYKINALSSEEIREQLDAANTENHQSYLADVIRVGEAGIRDDRINNAIRTIDTWYTKGGDDQSPIAIEPNGACLETGEFNRVGGKDHSRNAYALLRDIEAMTCKVKESDEADPEVMYLLASIIRGGVYGESSD